MKNTLIVSIIITTLLLSCKKDNIPLPNAWKGPQLYGSAKAKRNGQDWEGSSGWTYAIGDSTKIQLLMGTVDIVDIDTLRIESITIGNILTSEGEYIMKEFEEAREMRLPLASYGVGFDDEVDAAWVNNTKYKRLVTIESFDSITTTIKGRFNLTFKKIDNYGLEYPSKVTFEEGTFEARYIPPLQ